VHRDLKPENILLDRRGRVVVIDFGTAKDLIKPDLNGPEFVGTPDFMCPEAVNGTSGMQEAKEAVAAGKVGVDHTADLWAYGAILYLLQTGMTPFASPSPYLAMLKIKRALVTRPAGIADDEAWDLTQQLMRLDPATRLGATSFELVIDKSKPVESRTIKLSPGGYDLVRRHPYFAALQEIKEENDKNVLSTDLVVSKTPVPSLRDLCYTAVAEQATMQAEDFQLCDDHPPGDGSRHDMMRLERRDRDCVMHVLDRMKRLRDPRIYGRFFTDLVVCRLDSKIRRRTRDFVGMTQMNDDQGKAPKAQMNDPYATPVAVEDIEIVHLTNPLFVKSMNDSAGDDESKRKHWIKLLKKCIAAINKKRPKLVVVSGFVNEKCRKLLARISETVPVAIVDGSAFYSFWLMGAQCIALTSNPEAVRSKDTEQMVWVREQLDQVRMSKHPLFVFTDTDPRQLPAHVLKRLARGRTLAIYGVAETESFQTTLSYEPNEVISDDGESIQSTDSEEDDRDAFTMKMRGTHENGLRFIKVDEEPDRWNESFDKIALEGD